MRGSNNSVLCALRGPLTLITVGVLFALNNFTPYGFEKTWPVILIVFGLITLVCRGAAQPAAPQPPYPGTVPPYSYPPQTGGFKQSPYTQQSTGAPPASGTPPAGNPGETPQGGSV